VCCVLYSVIPKNCSVLERVFSVVLVSELYSFLYNFRGLAVVELVNPSKTKSYVYKIWTSSDAHTPKCVLCGSELIYLFR
jgi:hypothetical protein